MKAEAKIHHLIGAAGLVLAFMVVVIGCGKSGGGSASPADEGLPAEAIAVRQAFVGAGPSYENPVNEALKLVKAGSINPTAYVEVIPQLQRLAGNPTISSAQKLALDGLVEKLKAELAIKRP